MQFSIHLNMVKMLEWGLKSDPACIFAVVYEAPSWAKPHPHKSGFYYLTARKVCEEASGLGFQVDTVRKILKRLHEMGLLEQVMEGRDQYIKLTEKAKTWNKTTPDERPGMKKNAEPKPDARPGSVKNVGQKVSDPGCSSVLTPDDGAANHLTNYTKKSNRRHERPGLNNSAGDEEPVTLKQMGEWTGKKPTTPDELAKYLEVVHHYPMRFCKGADLAALQAWLNMVVTMELVDRWVIQAQKLANTTTPAIIYVTGLIETALTPTPAEPELATEGASA